MTTANWLTIAGLLIALGGGGLRISFRTNSRLASMEQQLVLIWKVLDKSLADCLHAPTHYERDDLGDRWAEGGLDNGDRERFLALLKEATAHDPDAKKAYAASIMIERVEMQMKRDRKRGLLGRFLGKCA